jgi:hypothetical protein
MSDIKAHIKGQVKFQWYRDGSLFYLTESGFLFPVPISDIGNATFLDEDRAILFMRWIRQELKVREAGNGPDTTQKA